MTGTKIVLICFGILFVFYIIGYIKYPELRKHKESPTVIIIQQE